jgi:hypothetical protein
MKSFGIALIAALALVVCASVVLAENSITSGPQVEKNVPGPFYPLNINGSAAGQKHCLFCENGLNPVAMVFARRVTPEVETLIKALDQETAKHGSAKMGSFVVFLSDNDGLEKQLKEMVQKDGLKKIVLSIDNPTGPEDYKVAKDADVTVVLYTKRVVKANHAFKKGELKKDDVQQIVADVTKILP